MTDDFFKHEISIAKNEKKWYNLARVNEYVWYWGKYKWEISQLIKMKEKNT
jgi:hypothetical protein